jgi:hypothetical protein
MSALLMTLVAGLAVGNGPERISSESAERLGLGGVWDVTVEGWQEDDDKSEETVTFAVKRKWGREVAVTANTDYAWIDEGDGRVSVRSLTTGQTIYLGIYKRQAGRLIICLMKYPKKGRPTAFRAGGGQVLATFQRPKPPK